MIVRKTFMGKTNEKPCIYRQWIAVDKRDLSTDYPRLARNGVLYPHLPVALVPVWSNRG